jgi:S-adenosylmethionine-diacylglycerol 3-amino-3-carboxypropyl transferase
MAGRCREGAPLAEEESHSARSTRGCSLRQSVSHGGTTAWLGRRIFDAVHMQNLVYNQCWEDPAVDRQALLLTPQDRVLVITSAGCNALDYALTGARVLAVDVNPRQNHLLQLKQAGIRVLDHCDFFQLFGRGGSSRAREIYAALRHDLGEPARAFWDDAIRLFEPARTRGRSFYYGGSAGLVAHLLRSYIERMAPLHDAVQRLFGAQSIEEQLAIYNAEVRRPLLGEHLLRLVGSSGVMSLLGVPEPQRQMVHSATEGFGGFLRSCLDRVMSVALLRDNYFWAVYLMGAYSRRSCPEYLKEDAFGKLKAGLVDNVTTYTGTVTDCLSTQTDPITAFVLLDHMDWLVQMPGVLEEEWGRIFAAAGPGARVIFRTSAADASFLPLSVRRRLRFDEGAEQLHRQDRVGTYASFHLAYPLPA